MELDERGLKIANDRILVISRVTDDGSRIIANR